MRAVTMDRKRPLCLSCALLLLALTSTWVTPAAAEALETSEFVIGVVRAA